MFNNQGSGTPFIAAGGWDAYTTAVGLYRADPNLYLANGSITDMNDARNVINGLAGKNFGGIVMIGHGNEEDGPLIGHVPVNEELVQLIAETLSPNGPRFVFFANCSAFQNPDIVKQFAEWAKKYNLTFIAANMDVNSPTSGKDPNRIRFGITDEQPDTFQWIMVTPGGIQYFNVNGLPSGIAPVIPPPPGNPGDNNAR
ncbi:hypothetical protein FGO68_gene9545 [Halteria grandinella]|uniref:Uncharacterized protein n=1 Tax=Halteria grandinella TaxID=5974 RepID=A0A8J8SUG5_HALGN|nr:hypothetical protein FGO68_gene9545 [Halteria grandinella]